MLDVVLATAAARFGTRTALLVPDRTWTFEDLNVACDALVHSLLSAGVERGERVAVMASNRAELPIAVAACGRIGAAAVLLSPAWKNTEVEHALALTNPTLAIADGDAVSTLTRHLPVADLDDPSVWADPGPDPAIRTGSAPEDESVLFFSSGTTGLPKAVVHTGTSLAHATRHWIDALDLTEADRFQVATPPTHILGLLNLLAAFTAGATVRLHRRFDIDDFLAHIESDRMTLAMAVAPMAMAMAVHPRLEAFDLSSLRFILWGATPVAAGVAESVTERTGIRWLVGYGASEVPVIACNPVRRPDEWRLDSVGLPVAGVDLRIADIDSGAPCPPGQPGEVLLRSESAMVGYLPPEANDDAYADGWFRTGDVGWIDDAGRLVLTDRLKEMIKVKGFQVAPAEIEAVLHRHPGVRDCAVFGVDDCRDGEVPVAAIEADPSHPTTAEELQDLVAEALATYKRIRHVMWVDAIPRLPSGKVLRRILRQQWNEGGADGRPARA